MKSESTWRTELVRLCDLCTADSGNTVALCSDGEIADRAGGVHGLEGGGISLTGAKSFKRDVSMYTGKQQIVGLYFRSTTFVCGVGDKPRSLLMLSKYSATRLWLQSPLIANFWHAK